MHCFRNKFLFSLSALAIAACSLSSASAQGVGFQKGKTYIGPTIGFGIGNSLGFGASGEYGVTENIGMGLDLGYTSFSQDLFGMASFDYTLFAALVAGSYHFSPNEKFDPFIKLGVGYFNWDASYTIDGETIDEPFGTSAAYASGVGITGQIGARYEFSPLLNGRLTVGYPFYVAAGLDFTFGGEGGRRSASGRSGSADETAPASTNAYTLYVGPYLHAKGSINTNPSAGYTTGFAFNSVPDFGATILAPFGRDSKIGFQLDIGHSSLAYKTIPSDRDLQSDSTNFIESYRYFTIAPGFNFAGFTIGVSFGSPVGASMESERGQSTHPIRGFFVDEDAKSLDYTDSLASITEVFIGGRIPLIDSQSGKLTFDIQASYTLTGLYENYASYKYAYEENKDGKMEAKEDRNPKPVALKMGLSYLFGIGF